MSVAEYEKNCFDPSETQRTTLDFVRDHAESAIGDRPEIVHDEGFVSRTHRNAIRVRRKFGAAIAKHELSRRCCSASAVCACCGDSKLNRMSIILMRVILLF